MKRRTSHAPNLTCELSTSEAGRLNQFGLADSIRRGKVPVCNRCSFAERDETIVQWIAGKQVGYCLECDPNTLFNEEESQEYEKRPMPMLHSKKSSSARYVRI